MLYDTNSKGKNKRIVLDDSSSKGKYTPPDSLVVHLSKIEMPELQPKSSVHGNDKSTSKKKEEKKSWWT